MEWIGGVGAPIHRIGLPNSRYSSYQWKSKFEVLKVHPKRSPTWNAFWELHPQMDWIGARVSNPSNWSTQFWLFLQQWKTKYEVSKVHPNGAGIGSFIDKCCELEEGFQSIQSVRPILNIPPPMKVHWHFPGSSKMESKLDWFWEFHPQKEWMGGWFVFSIHLLRFG